MPSQAERLAWGSTSTRRTRLPLEAISYPRSRAREVFPAPPAWVKRVSTTPSPPGASTSLTTYQ